ncbi:hypothetical protein USB125703_01668 [Pseudoclavibacter triregionum]|nr:hypothetical protein USB125703_01668 [Pseudoclavibacter triregionum]
MEPKMCAADGCDEVAAFPTRTRRAWCNRHIDELLAEGGLQPLEPFVKPGVYRLTRCLTCGAEAHYKLEYTIDRNQWHEPTCRACFWRKWYIDSAAMGGVSRPRRIAVGTVDRGREVIADLGGGVYLYRCQNCGRQTPERPGDFPDVCGCSGALGGRRGELDRNLSRELHEQFVATVRKSNVTADTITSSSKRLVLWRDPICGHEWAETVHDRQKVPRWRCPECRTILDSLAYHFPEVAAEWSASNPQTAWQVRPTGTTPYKPEWQCPDDPSHLWHATIGQRTTGYNQCPMCRQSGKSWVELEYAKAAEALFGNAVSGKPISDAAFKRQGTWYPDITVTLPSKRLLLIEYDGSYWHGAKVELDTEKTNDLLATGALVVRLREEPLPMLEIHDDGFLQLPVPSRKHDHARVVRDIQAWVDAR